MFGIEHSSHIHKKKKKVNLWIMHVKIHGLLWIVNMILFIDIFHLSASQYS